MVYAPNSKVRSATFALVVPWLSYVATLTCISLVERTEFDRARVFDVGFNIFDLAFHLIAWLGLIAAVLWSVRAMNLRKRTTHRGACVVGIVAASFCGPLLGIVAIWTLADDVDGITMYLLSPALGVLVASVALVVVAIHAWLTKRKSG